MLDLPLVLQIIATAAVTVGVVFGLAEVRQAIQHRRDYAAVDIIRTVQTQEVRQAVARILGLPDNVDPDVIRNDPLLLDAALAVDSACEMWGAMVYEGIVDHRMLDRMVGGWVRGSWSRLRLWVEDERVVNRNPNVGEWWQWLHDWLEADADPGKELGAHVAYAGKKANRESTRINRESPSSGQPDETLHLSR